MLEKGGWVAQEVEANGTRGKLLKYLNMWVILFWGHSLNY